MAQQILKSVWFPLEEREKFAAIVARATAGWYGYETRPEAATDAFDEAGRPALLSAPAAGSAAKGLASPG